MVVEVIITATVPPIDKDLKYLRLAASELTSSQDSVTVNVEEEIGIFFLTTTFKMKTTAQYKVVDHICKQFEYSTFDLEGYQEMCISFSR